MKHWIEHYLFYKNFNLRFQQPKKDTCTKCDSFDSYKLKSPQQDLPNCAEQLATINIEKELHHANAEKARNSLVDYRKRVQNNGDTIDVIIFDLQSILPTPRLSSNVWEHYWSTSKCF